jgi:hypothetical protein
MCPGLLNKLHSKADAMVNESSQPKPGDAVMGGQNPDPLINAAVLGGIEGAQQRCASPDVQARIAGMREAVKYGEAGIELLVHGLKDEVSEVGLAAYFLLEENVEPELKRPLEIYKPSERKISNLNMVDPIRLFHSYLEIKQPQNSHLYEAIQLLNNGTKAEKKIAFSELKSRQEPVVKGVLWSYINTLEPVVKGVLWSYINTLEPQVADRQKLLKYFLALDRLQEAQEETEKIFLHELGCKDVKAINNTSEIGFLSAIYELWEIYTKAYSRVGFLTVLRVKIDDLKTEEKKSQEHWARWSAENEGFGAHLRDNY